MSVAREHADWLSLLDISGPFLSLPVLQRAFPQGIEAVSTGVRGDLRAAYAHWLDERDTDPAIHHRWVHWILTGPLELDHACLAEGPRIPGGLERHVPEHHETLRPDIALLDDAGKPALLVHIQPPGQDLTKPLRGSSWKASPDTRMAELLRGTGIPLGLVTNGERWMLVHAPPKETAGYASWYGDLWVQEPLTLRAFVALFRRGRFFGVAESERLPALLRDSAQDQADVTDQLGAQVRAAVHVLVQAFDKLDAESARSLLAGVDERALYEAALTVMMRLVFLLSAEERKLLLRGDPLYDQHYAVGTILDSLQEKADRHGEEILERSCDAWSRLLAVFRAVHGGVQHERLRLPAYGGALFDPDRFPFLEGRGLGSSWRVNAANPLKVNNRVVLHLLRALQFIETKLPGGGDLAARRLSFRGLDIEQIGHVYEGLLDHTARRATQVILGLAASKGRIAALPLELLEDSAGQSQEKLLKSIVEETGRSESSVRKILVGSDEKSRRGRKATVRGLDLLSVAEAPAAYHAVPHAILAACDHDAALAARVAPFAALLRSDTFGRQLVILPGSLYVAPGSDRRSTGTHYTPRSLTEPIVQQTLEPLVYHGPAEGLPRDRWRLKAPRDILVLKVCDLAMGSGAFLVAACRYLSARLVEAWAEVERAHPDAFITSPEGDLSTGDPSEALLVRLPDDERLHLAARAVADRCLYGVDINPMAVEMAKLSLWLVTVDRERPFTFLDHVLKCGDTLLGLSNTRQLERFSLREADAAQPLLDTSNLWRHVRQAAELRRRLEATPSHTATQLVEKARLHGEAETLLARLRAAADFLIAAELDCPGDRGWVTRRAVAASHMQAGWKKDVLEFQNLARAEIRGRRPFHWPLEFPEIFEAGENGESLTGFHAFVGNPPFLGGKKISGNFGDDYRAHIATVIGKGRKGVADFSVFFMLRALTMACAGSDVGLVITSSIAEGDTREVGLDHLDEFGAEIIAAEKNRTWPGTASVTYSSVIIAKKTWHGEHLLDGVVVPGISSSLTSGGASDAKPERLAANEGLSFIGTYILGTGFTLDPAEARNWREKHPAYDRVLFPFLSGGDMNNDPAHAAPRWIINFFDWPLDRDSAPAGYVGPVASDFQDLLAIVRRDVKPLRDKCNRRVYRERWWQFGEKAVDLYRATRGKRWVLGVASAATKYVEFAVLPPDIIYGHSLTIIPSDNLATFASLTSDLHKEWVREYASYNLSLIRYTPSDCLETFPFPADLRSLESIGERYHEHRRQLMLARGEGLTKTYNRFHDPGETAADIAELRSLHRQLDEAVAAAYSWADLAANDGAALGHDFHETKQGLRFTLAPAARREVLDRLLALNHHRHAEEVAAGLHEKKKKRKTILKPKAADSAPVSVTLELDFGAPVPIATQDAALAAMTLLPYLLSEGIRQETSLRMSELKRAFDFVSNPTLMQQAAMAVEKAAVNLWATGWQSKAGPEWFFPALRRLAGGTIRAMSDEDDPLMGLVVAPTQPDSPDLRKGIRLALRVVRSARPLPPVEQAEIVRERRSIFAHA